MATEKGYVCLQEVGTRDGLQNEPRSLAPETRAELIEALAEAGIPRIQIGSFVNPRRVPQMLGTHLVWRLLRKRSGTRYTVLVLNEKGLSLAIAEQIPHVEVYVSASETHSLTNTGMHRDKALGDATHLIETALSCGLEVTAGVMCAFGCFYEGPVSAESVLRIVSTFEEHSPTEICVADSTGMAEPYQVRAMLELLEPIIGVERIGVHLHDTRGLGFANLRAALDVGVRNFDTSLGGLGGCPFIPDARGNISTERASELLESWGYEVRVNRDKIIAVRDRLKKLLGKGLPVENEYFFSPAL